MKTIITIAISFAYIVAFAQTDSSMVKTETVQPSKHNKNTTPFIKKVYFGGDFGMSFGPYTTVTVAPMIGYIINPKLHTGFQFHYTWAKHSVKTITGDKSYNYNNYGFSTFIRWYAIKNLYFHLEPELMNYQQNTIDSNGDVVNEDRYWVPYIWAGAGLRKMIGKRSWMSAHILFDLLNDKNSPYNEWEPRYSVGFGTSF